MPITIPGIDGYEILALLNMPPADIALLKDNGAKIQILTNQMSIEADNCILSVPVKSGQLQLLKNGGLHNISKQALQIQVASALKTYKSSIGKEVSAQTNAPIEPVGTLAKLMAKAPVTVAEDVWSALSDVATMPTIPLKTATHLYQPVNGTSKTSRYYVIAACPVLRIAARYSTNSLSIRVEGPEFSKWKSRLAEVGFTGMVDTPSSQYASMHLSIAGDDILAQKTIGALILSIEAPWKTALPSIHLIKTSSAS